MKIAAGIIGLITGFLSLMYVGVFGGLIGSAAGWLSSFDPNGGELSSWASMVKTLSYVAPVLLLAGGGVTFARPPFGGILLALRQIPPALHNVMMLGLFLCRDSDQYP